MSNRPSHLKLLGQKPSKGNGEIVTGAEGARRACLEMMAEAYRDISAKEPDVVSEERGHQIVQELHTPLLKSAVNHFIGVMAAGEVEAFTHVGKTENGHYVAFGTKDPVLGQKMAEMISRYMEAKSENNG